MWECFEVKAFLNAYFNTFFSKVAFKDIFFLKIEHLESLQEVVLKKICRTVFGQNYVMLSISV